MNYWETVLIVDDDPTLLEQAEQILSGRYHVSLATSGAQALRYLQSGQGADLILLDILMPDMDGYETLTAIRGFPGYEDVPVVYLTSVAGPEAEVKGLNVGAADYITKPFHPKVLLTRVEARLRTGNCLDGKKLAARPFPLTESEYRVAKLLARARSNEEIGLEMNYALDTVKKLVSRVLEKLDIKSRKEIKQYMPLWVAVVLLIACAGGAAVFSKLYGKRKKARFVALKVAASLLGLVLLAYAILTLTLLTGVR